MSRGVCRYGWLAWSVVTVGGFTLLEVEAIRRRCHPPLSGVMADINRELRRRTGCRWAAPVIFAGFWLWLTVHVVRFKADGGIATDRRR